MNKIMLLLSILVCFALQSAEMSLLRRGSEGQALKEQQELIDNQQEASLPVQVVGLENIQNIIDKNKSEAITYLSDEIKRIDDIALDLINQDLDNAVKNIHAFKIKDYIEKLRAVIELLNDNQFRNALDSLNELEKEYPEEIEFKESKIRLNNIIKILNESLSNVIEESPTRNVLITLNSILEKIDQQDLYERHLYRGKLQEQEKAYVLRLIPLIYVLIEKNKKDEALGLLNNINNLKHIDKSIKIEIEEVIKKLRLDPVIFPKDLSNIINTYGE